MSKRAVRFGMHCQVTSSDVLQLAAWIVHEAEDWQAPTACACFVGLADASAPCYAAI
jgi:hypothetical protein